MIATQEQFRTSSPAQEAADDAWRELSVIIPGMHQCTVRQSVSPGKDGEFAIQMTLPDGQTLEARTENADLKDAMIGLACLVEEQQAIVASTEREMRHLLDETKTAEH